MMSLVSVVMPCFNCSDSIIDSVNSVLSQTFDNFEVIIVDDASTDGSVELLEELFFDSRLKIYRLPENSGVGNARNFGISKAKSRYIAFLDSDDLWSPTKLEEHLDFMVNNESVFSCTNYSFKSGSKIIEIDSAVIFYKDLLKSNSIGCLTVIYDSKILGKVFMPPIRKRQDYACWLNILSKGHKCDVFKKSLSIYNNERPGISNNKFEMIYWNYIMFRSTQNMSYLRAILMTSRNVLFKIFSLRI